MSTINVTPLPVSQTTVVSSRLQTFHSLSLSHSSRCSLSCQPYISHKCPALEVSVNTSVNPFVEKIVNGYESFVGRIVLDYSVSAHVTFVRWKMYTVDLADRILDMVVDLKSRP